MPIYDYVCETCGHVMEVIHGINAEGPLECPQCGGPMAKVFAAPAIHFKGSGWAKKDRKSVSGPVKPRSSSESGARDASTGSTGSTGSSEPGEKASSGSTADGPKEG